jgi:hypothetical protein
MNATEVDIKIIADKCVHPFESAKYEFAWAKIVLDWYAALKTVEGQKPSTKSVSREQALARHEIVEVLNPAPNRVRGHT